MNFDIDKEEEIVRLLDYSHETLSQIASDIAKIRGAVTGVGFFVSAAAGAHMIYIWRMLS